MSFIICRAAVRPTWPLLHVTLYTVSLALTESITLMRGWLWCNELAPNPWHHGNGSRLTILQSENSSDLALFHLIQNFFRGFRFAVSNLLAQSYFFLKVKWWVHATQCSHTSQSNHVFIFLKIVDWRGTTLEIGSIHTYYNIYRVIGLVLMVLDYSYM